MKVINSKLAAIGLAAFVFASCSDSTSDGGQNPLSPDVTTIGLQQSDAALLANSVTNYKNSARSRATRAADATVFNGLTEMKNIPEQPNTGISQVQAPANLENGKFFVKGNGLTVDLSDKTIKNAEIWINGGATVIYNATAGGNKIYVEKDAKLVFKGTGSAIASNDEVIVASSGAFESDNDITIDGTLYSTTSIGAVNKNENKEITGPAQNVTINGNVYLYGYQSPKKVDNEGNPIWSFASIRAKKLTVGANARVNVEDKISFTNDAEINGAVHVGKTMEVDNLTIGSTGNVSSDISVKVKKALTMNGGKLAVDYLNVTDNTYTSDGTENKKKTATGTATATLNGNCNITVNKLGVLNFNTLKTDNTAGQIVLNSNDASSYAVIKADNFEYTGEGEVNFLSTPNDNTATFLLQFSNCKANGTDKDFKDLAFSASYLDYDVATNGAALEEVTEAGKYHTWQLKEEVANTIKKLPKLDLVSSLKSLNDKQSATSILPYNGNLYLSYHTNGETFGGNIEVAKMTGSQLTLVQDLYDNGEGKADYNHLNVIDGKLYLAGSNRAGSIMAYANINGDGTVSTDLTQLPFSTGSTAKDEADYGDANCVAKYGNKIYVASTRGYEIFDPANGYLHSYLATAGKAKFIVAANNNLYGLNYTSAIRANSDAVEGQIQAFNTEDLSSTATTFNVGQIAPNNGKNMIAVDGSRVYVCQSAKGLVCYENGTAKWTWKAPISKSSKNNLVDNVEGYANGVAVKGNYIYVAAGSYGLVVLDKDGNVVAHRNIGTFSANYVAVDNSENIYVAYGQNRVQVFKLTNTAK